MATTLPQPALARPLTSVERLGLMSAEGRLRLPQRGMTRVERAAWAARFPDEVPLINDEFKWPAWNLE
jgi:hypothetical protein